MKFLLTKKNPFPKIEIIDRSLNYKLFYAVRRYKKEDEESEKNTIIGHVKAKNIEEAWREAREKFPQKKYRNIRIFISFKDIVEKYKKEEESV